MARASRPRNRHPAPSPGQLTHAWARLPYFRRAHAWALQNKLHIVKPIGHIFVTILFWLTAITLAQHSAARRAARGPAYVRRPALPAPPPPRPQRRCVRVNLTIDIDVTHRCGDVFIRLKSYHRARGRSAARIPPSRACRRIQLAQRPAVVVGEMRGLGHATPGTTLESQSRRFHGGFCVRP